MWDNTRQLNQVALVIAVAAVAMLVYAATLWAVRQPVFALQEVVIRGPLTRANPAHLEAVVREELRGTFFTLRLADARESLVRVPWVRAVGLRRAWPKTLEIIVTEHDPLARWNEASLVNVQGETFTADYNGELPQFSGPEGRAADVAAHFREFGQTVKPIGLSLAEIRLSERAAWEIKTEGPNPLMLELGRVDPGARLARFVEYYPGTVAKLQRAGTRVERIDLRYRNGFAARVPGFRETPVKKPAPDQVRGKV
jgi:cell division protein FtsQ